MIFSGQRNTNGSVGAETSDGLGPASLTQPVASNLATSGSGIVSATSKPIIKPTVVLGGRSSPQPIKPTSMPTFSTVAKWQPSQPVSGTASRQAGSWW